MLRIFSSGGGVQSTAALVLSAQGKIDYPIHVFSNVGDRAESPQTIAYIRDVIKPYAAKHGIEWIEVCRRNKEGEAIDLYDWLLTKEKDIPIPVKLSGSGAPGNRSCTEKWKIKPVSDFLLNWAIEHSPELKKALRNRKLTLRCETAIRIRDRQFFGLSGNFSDDELTIAVKKQIHQLRVTQPLTDKQQQDIEALKFDIKQCLCQLHFPIVLGKGISTDEFARARSESGFPHYIVDYPLINLRISRNDCLRIVADAGLPTPPKSSCWFCPFKTLARWQDQRRDEPELFNKSVHLERLLSDRAIGLGRGATYFTSRGTSKNAYLDEITSDQLSLFDQQIDEANLDFCESGFCMT